MGNYSHIDGRSRFHNAVDSIDDPSLGSACGLPAPHASVGLFEEEIRRGFKLPALEIACRRAVVLSQLGSGGEVQAKMSSQQLGQVHRFAFLAADDVSDIGDPILFKHPVHTSNSPGRQLPLRDWNTRIHYDFGMGDEEDTCHRSVPPTITPAKGLRAACRLVSCGQEDRSVCLRGQALSGHPTRGAQTCYEYVWRPGQKRTV